VRAVSVAGLCLLVLALTACSEPTPNATALAPTSAPTAQVFKSKAKALEAAKAVYERYLSIGQAVSESGGRGADRFHEVLAGEAFAEERRGVEVLRARNLVTTGATRLTAFKLQSADLRSGSVAAYACIDLEKVRVRTAAGRDVTPAKRVNKQIVRPLFVWDSGRLLLKENGSWVGEPVC
jgi:hypothetical protein